MKDECSFFVTAALAVCLPLAVAHGALDIRQVVVMTEYEHLDGVPDGPFPWDFEIEVELVSPGTLDRIDLTIPGAIGPSYALTPDEPNEWQFDPAKYDSLAALRADFPEGVYTLEFRDSSNVLLRTISLDNSGLATPTGIVDFTYPSVDGQTNVNTYPTFTWTVAEDAGDVLAIGLDDLDLSGDGTVYRLAPAPMSTTSWTPGPLLANRNYDLDIDVATVKDWVGPEFPVMTVDDDAFTYIVALTYFNEIRFVTGSQEPVYRFWSPWYLHHFYTISTTERDYVLNTWPDAWTYEGVVYHAYSEGSQPQGTSPVYRFWSDTLGGHFYTISESERDYVLATWPDAWTDEGIVYYAYPEGSPPEGTSPVYRFWSDALGGHFYTISEAEKDYVLATWPDTWAYEGIAWYAYE